MNYLVSYIGEKAEFCASAKLVTPGACLRAEEQPKMVATKEDALVAYLLRADIDHKSFVEAAGFSDTRGRRP